VLVLNGDTFVDADLAGFADRHRESGASLSLLCVEVDDAARYGRIERDTQGFVSGFVEKDSNHRGLGLISAGFYLFSAAFLDQLVNFPGPSLERDLFQRLPSGTIRTEVARGGFVDIGTPESLAQVTRIGLGAMSR
jgi:mannose-1-phosphate guanylyltransferase